MCSCYSRIKKTVKFVCFWVIVLASIDAGVTAVGCQFLSAILTPNAEIVVKILAALSAGLVVLMVAVGRGCHGKCKCGCDCGCDCGCTCNECKCGDECKCDDECKCGDKNKDGKVCDMNQDKQDKKPDITNKK